MKKFEYKFTAIWNSGSYLEGELNRLGQEGWELVACREKYYFIFKRKLQDNNKKEGL